MIWTNKDALQRSFVLNFGREYSFCFEFVYVRLRIGNSWKIGLVFWIIIIVGYNISIIVKWLFSRWSFIFIIKYTQCFSYCTKFIRPPISLIWLISKNLLWNKQPVILLCSLLIFIRNLLSWNINEFRSVLSQLIWHWLISSSLSLETLM